MNNRSYFHSAIVVLGAIVLFATMPWVLKSVFATLDDTDTPAADDHPTAPAAPPPQTESTSGSDIDWAHIWMIVGIVIAALLVLAAGVVTTLWVRRQRTRSRVSRETVEEQWNKAEATLSDVSDSYAAFNADVADQIFTRPLLADTTEPHTAAFISAYNAAQAAAFTSRPDDKKLADTALAEAVAARDAWDAASAHARNVGLGDLNPRQRVSLRRASRLLEQALDPGTTSDNRNNLIDKIVDLVTDVTTAADVKTPPIRSLISDSVTRQLTASTAGRGPSLSLPSPQNINSMTQLPLEGQRA